MYEIYAASVGLQEHEMASTLKVLRGDHTTCTGEGMYYYGQQPNLHVNTQKRWGYEDDYAMRCANPGYPPELGTHPSLIMHPHHGRQSQSQADYLDTQKESSRLSQRAMQNWDTMQLVDKRDSCKERETTQGVTSLAFLYGAMASHSAPTASSSTASALGSSSDGNRSPDSDDPSEAATDHSQSSGSLCGGNGGDRGSVSSVSQSSVETSYKRSCHGHHNSPQWQAGSSYPHDQSEASDTRKPPYQQYEKDGYSGIYPTFMSQKRQHSTHQQLGLRPANPHTNTHPAPQQMVYGQQLNAHLQTQTQAQMMHARYLNYQHNVRQGQGKDAAPKVSPIVIPSSHYSSQSKPEPVIATLMDDHAHWASKPLVVKNLSSSTAKEQYQRVRGDGVCSGGSLESDAKNVLSLSFARTKGTVMPILIGQAHTQAALSKSERNRDRDEDKYVVLLPGSENRDRDGLVPSSSMGAGSDDASLRFLGTGNTRGSNSTAQRNGCDGDDNDDTGVEASLSCNEVEEEGPACGNLVLDEPLGDATHALLSFCMQRNPWMYAPLLGSKADGEEQDSIQGLGPGPTALHKDVVSCLIATPLLREELECYSEALNPSPFPQGARGHRRRSKPSSSTAASTHTRTPFVPESSSRRRRDATQRRAHDMIGGTECDDSSSDENERERESSEGDLTDDSLDSDEQLSVQARSLSYCNKMSRKRDAVEEMRSFTTFASLRMQEVCDLVCEQEARRAARREEDRDRGLNHWSMQRDGSSRDAAASAAAASFVKALEMCTQTWWAYANLYK
jgi:hypothetical protein